MKSYKKMTQSHQETEKELYDAIKTGGGSIDIVDKVEEGNMQAVTSNAVYNAVKHDIVQEGTVNIKVLDKNTKTPLSSVVVILDEDTGTTDNIGECSFEEIDYGTHFLKISNTTYTHFQGINLYDKVKNITIELGEDKGIEYSRVTANVRNSSTGQGILNAYVSLAGNTLLTDVDGVCVFEKLAYGTTRINVKAENYEDYNNSITLNQPETVLDINLVEKTSPTGMVKVSGLVMDDGGSLPNVIITEANSKASTTSNENGIYSLSILRDKIIDNRILLKFSKECYTDITLGKAISDEDTYTLPNQVMDLKEDLYHESGVSGVTHHDIYNVGGIAFTLKSQFAKEEYSLTSDSKGEFNNGNMSAGWYDVIITGDDYFMHDVKENAFFLRPKEILKDYKIILTSIDHEFKLTVTYKDSGEAVQNTPIEIYTKTGSAPVTIAKGSTNTKGIFIFNIPENVTAEIYARLSLSDGSQIIKAIGSSTEDHKEISI